MQTKYVLFVVSTYFFPKLTFSGYTGLTNQKSNPLMWTEVTE